MNFKDKVIFAPNRYSNSSDENEYFQKLRDLVADRKAKKHLQKESPDKYFGIREYQENGNPHYHCILVLLNLVGKVARLLIVIAKFIIVQSISNKLTNLTAAKN